MKGLGFYTGKIYDDDQRHSAKECCHCITDQQASDDEWIREQHLKDIASCLFCNGCPESNRESV